MSDLMKIDFNNDVYVKAVECEEFLNPKCVYVFRDKNNVDRFVMLDTNGPNYIHRFIVRCMFEEHKIIKDNLISIVNEMREEEGQSLIDDLKNTFYDDKNGYNEVLKRFNLNNI